jgi:elongation factor G
MAIPPHPLLSLTLQPHSTADAERLTRGLDALMREDPTIRVRTDSASGKVVIGAIGERQLDIIVDRLARAFEVSADISGIEVGYTETVTREAGGEIKYTTTAPPQYAHVKLTVYPVERGSGHVFENLLVGEAIPTDFWPAVEAGVEDALEAGVLAGYPVQDVRVVLYDGSWHDVDSSAAAFRSAASMALREALRKANPVVLEPLMRVLISAPSGFKASVHESFAGRRAQPVSVAVRDGTLIMDVRAPLAAMLGYAGDLRQRTRGLGTFRMSFDRYEPLQPADEDDAHGVREPLHPRPSPRSGSISLPLDEA